MDALTARAMTIIEQGQIRISIIIQQGICGADHMNSENKNIGAGVDHYTHQKSANISSSTRDKRLNNVTEPAYKCSRMARAYVA